MSTRLYGSHTTWLKRVKNEDRERTYNCQHTRRRSSPPTPLFDPPASKASKPLRRRVTGSSPFPAETGSKKQFSPAEHLKNGIISGRR